MALPFSGCRIGQRKGFSLLELIVALAVIGVAGTVLVSMYASSVDLGRSARNRTVAAQLAEEQLGAILRHPDQFRWEVPATASKDPFPISPMTEAAKGKNLVKAPSAMPLNDNSFQREAALYEQFSWTAQGRLPDVNAAHYEVTVVMHWAEAGQPQMLALTGAIPRFQIPSSGGAKP